MNKNEKMLFKCQSTTHKNSTLKMIQSHKNKSVSKRSDFMKLMSNKISKACTHLVDMKAMRCYSVISYIILCLVGNIITGLFLYYHYDFNEKNESTSGIMRKDEETTNQISDERAQNDTILADDWISGLKEVTKKKPDSLLKDERAEVSFVVGYQKLSPTTRALIVSNE